MKVKTESGTIRNISEIVFGANSTVGLTEIINPGEPKLYVTHKMNIKDIIYIKE